MTNQRDLERTLDAFLAVGADEVADRVIDDALLTIDHTTQRRALSGPWRSFAMSTLSKLAVAAVVVLAVGGATWMLGRSPGPGAGGAPTSSAALSPTSSAALSPDLSAGTPGLVTGRLRYDAAQEWQEEAAVKGGKQERVRVRQARSEMSDARLSGSVTVTDNADRFIAVTDEFRGDVLWGTIVIENDQGTWTGSLTGTTDLAADGLGVTYIELVGAGGYKGLSAILFERETPTTLDWNGVIFSGNLPPDR